MSNDLYQNLKIKIIINRMSHPECEVLYDTDREFLVGLEQLAGLEYLVKSVFLWLEIFV